MGVDINNLIDTTEKITGFKYKKTDQPKQENKKNFHEISEIDALDFFTNLAEDQEEET